MKFDKDITKIKRVTFFLRHSVYTSVHAYRASHVAYVRGTSRSLALGLDKKIW